MNYEKSVQKLERETGSTLIDWPGKQVGVQLVSIPGDFPLERIILLTGLRKAVEVVIAERGALAFKGGQFSTTHFFKNRRRAERRSNARIGESERDNGWRRRVAIAPHEDSNDAIFLIPCTPTPDATLVGTRAAFTEATNQAGMKLKHYIEGSWISAVERKAKDTGETLEDIWRRLHATMSEHPNIVAHHYEAPFQEMLAFYPMVDSRTGRWLHCCGINLGSSQRDAEFKETELLQIVINEPRG